MPIAARQLQHHLSYATTITTAITPIMEATTMQAMLVMTVHHLEKEMTPQWL